MAANLRGAEMSNRGRTFVGELFRFGRHARFACKSRGCPQRRSGELFIDGFLVQFSRSAHLHEMTQQRLVDYNTDNNIYTHITHFFV